MLSSDIVIVLLGTSVAILTAILLNRQRKSSKKTTSKDPWGTKDGRKQNSDYIYIDQ